MKLPSIVSLSSSAIINLLFDFILKWHEKICTLSLFYNNVLYNDFYNRIKSVSKWDTAMFVINFQNKQLCIVYRNTYMACRRQYHFCATVTNHHKSHKCFHQVLRYYQNLHYNGNIITFTTIHTWKIWHLHMQQY